MKKRIAALICLLLSLLLDYMDGLSCRPEQVSREISENLLQRLGDSLEQDAGALRRLWQSYWVSGRSRAYRPMAMACVPDVIECRAKPASASIQSANSRSHRSRPMSS